MGETHSQTARNKRADKINITQNSVGFMNCVIANKKKQECNERVVVHSIHNVFLEGMGYFLVSKTTHISLSIESAHGSCRPIDKHLKAYTE